MFSAQTFYDGLFIASAILFNLLIAALFIAQKRGRQDLVRFFGVTWLLLSLPLGVVFIQYLVVGKPTWVYVAFGLVFLYMLAEYLLDYFLKYDFRKRWRTHIPYILVEYLALFSLIAIAIQVDQNWGWVVSGSFWILMGCLIYLYAGRRTRQSK